MFQNYLKTALRNLMRSRLFSAINIAGLAIGLAAFILIMLFVRDERSWDNHWPEADNLYQIDSTLSFSDREDRHVPRTMDPVKDLLLDTYSEIEDITRFLGGRVSVRKDDGLVSEYVMLVESNFPKVLGLTFLAGNADKALLDPTAVVLSQRAATRLLGEQAPQDYIGQTLTTRQNGKTVTYAVSGIIENPVHDTHLNYDMLVKMLPTYFEGARWFSQGWDFAYWRTYARLKDGTDTDLIKADLPALLERHVPKENGGMENGSSWSLTLNFVPVSAVHLVESYGSANPTTLYGLVTVAFLILAIAIVNFLNLSMARTAYRAREVAMRKVLGAGRRQIIQQFLGEAVLLALVSLFFALVMVELALPYYNEFLASMVDLDVAGQPTILLAIILLGITVGLSAGSMQSLYFSMLKPRDVLYSSTAPDNSTGKLRMALVVAQFAVAVALMVIAFFVNKQVEYARSLDLGFNPNDLIVVSGTSGSQSDDFKNRLLASPYIKAVGRSSDVPTEGSEDRVQMRAVGSGDEVQLDGLPTDPDFFRAYEISLLAGRYLNESEADIMRERTEDGTYREAGNIVINESGAELLGFQAPEAAIGETFKTNLRSNVVVDATIVGVVSDFHFDSARSVIRPGIYYNDHGRQADMSVRLDGRYRDEAISHIEQVWRATYPDNVLRYRVMKDMVERQYQADDRLGGVLTAFTFLAILVSSLGLYGLASFTVERRTKEIGIRKVLGAGIRDIVTLLLWQFSKPILLANLLAWPAAFYFLSDWLSNFVYRIDIDVWPFLVLGGAALLLGWFTVVGRAVLVARSNPINALRYE